MDMTKTKDEIVQKKEWHGVLSCDFKYKIATTDVLLDYKGPKIPFEEWHKLMSFFRWTYQTTHSEAQARGFIDPVDKKLFFWVFPQEARTGMTTKEIEGDEWKKQRAELPHAGELEYFMTVHHHCAASAFQSGGDRNNEERPGGGAHETGQEGLHITVGNMDKDVHDLDVRFYFNGVKLAPSMINFWDIGDEIRDMVPHDLRDKVARYQMCRKVELEFPDNWKENFIEVKYSQRDLPARYQGGMGYSIGGFDGYGSGTPYKSLQDRIDESSDEILNNLILSPEEKLSVKDVGDSIRFLNASTVFEEVLRVCALERYDCLDLKNLIVHLLSDFEEMEDEMEREKQDEDHFAVAVDKTENSGNGKSGKRKGRKPKDNVEVVQQEPGHGTVNGMGQHWDADLGSWVSQT